VAQLLARAEQHFHQRPASPIDPEDIVPSVLRTFFSRVKAGQCDLEYQDDLCNLLARITVHKMLRQVAFRKATKPDASQEPRQGEAPQEGLPELLDRGPSPEAAVAFLDQLEHFFSRFRPQDCQILKLRMEGYGNEEIAAKLGTADRRIRRLTERVRGLAEQWG
jgi:hypothetical protein